MFTPIAGRSIVITGGTRGIGKGIARVFAAAGGRVVVTGRDAAQGEAAVRELGENASFVQGDVRSAADCERVVAAAVERHGGLDVVCANAGVFPSQRLEHMTEDDIDEIFATNVRGCMLTVQAALAALERSGRGRVIITSSITGPITGYPGWSHYGATKAAQLGFMRTAAIELAPRGITINAVLPGNITTEGLDALGPEYRRKMEASIPQRTLGTVEDIGHVALFLATDEARYVTGQAIAIDGGQVLPESIMALEEM